MKKITILAVGLLLLAGSHVGFAQTGSPPKIETTQTVFKQDAQITVNYENKFHINQCDVAMTLIKTTDLSEAVVKNVKEEKRILIGKPGTAKGSVFHRYNKLPHNAVWRTSERIA